MKFSRRAKRRIIVIGAAGLLVVAAGGVFKVLRGMQQSRLQADARQRGLATYDGGDFEKALGDLGYVISQDKSDVEVLLAFADARARTPMTNARHVMEALGYYKAGVALLEDPQAVMPESMDREQEIRRCWSRMIEMYSMLGMRYEAKETAARLLAHDPDNVDALTAIVQVHWAERDYAEALRAVARLVEIEPQEVRWRELYLAIMREAGQDHSALVAQCAQWLSEHQGDGRYHVLEAAVLADAGRFEEATEAIKSSAVLGADTLDVLSKQVSILDALGQYKLAEQVIDKTASRYPNAEWVQQAVIRRLWQANQINEALSRLEAFEQPGTPLAPELAKLKALCLLSVDRPDAAVAALDPLTAPREQYDREAEADRAWAHAVIARAQFESDDYRNVLRLADHALVYQPRDAVLHSIMGRTYAEMGEDALSVQQFERAYRLDPSWLGAGVTYIEALMRTGRVEEAYRTAVELLRRQPTDVLAPFVLCAKAYMDLLRSGQVEQLAVPGGPRPDIVGLLETLHDERPDDAVLAALLAEGYVLNGRTDLARRFINASIESDNATAALLLELARVCRRYDIELIEPLIRRAEALAPQSLAVSYLKADVLAQQGRPEQGLAVLDQALAKADEASAHSLEAERARVSYLLRTGHPDAMAALRAFVQQNTDTAAALSYALEQTQLWQDQELVRSVIDALAEIVGRSSQQVRLAEANYLMRFRPDDEADLARAMVLINGVLEESPDSLAALTLLANASLLGERPSIERALVNLQRAIERYPGATPLYPVFIDLLQRQGDYATAERYLERFAALAERQPRWRPDEIRLLSAQGNFERALVKASSLVNEQSGTTDQLALASMYRRSGRSDEAEAIYKRLLDSTQPGPMAIERAAEFYAMRGEAEQAERLLESYEPAHGETWRKDLLRGRFAMQFGDPSQARGHLEAALKANPDSVEVRYELARHHLGAERFDAAHETALAALRDDPLHRGLRTVLALATIRLDQQTRRETLDFWNSLGAGDDALLKTLTLMQEVRFENGRAAATMSDIERARRLASENSSFLPAWMLAISLMADAGQQGGAIDMARRAVGRFPSEPQVARWATTMLMSAGRWSEALMEAQEWRRRSLDDPIDADVAMTTILLELGREQDAMEQIAGHGERILDQRDRRAERVGPWLRALLADNRWTEASRHAARLVEEHGRWRNLWMSLTVTMSPDQAYDALSMVEREIEQPREYLDLSLAWQSLAARTDERSYFARADALAVRAAELDASLQTNVLMTRGLIAEGNGEAVTAERYYRQVIERDPDNIATLNNLAYLMVRHGRRYEQALPLIERALENAPDHPDLLDTLGQVLTGLGRLDDATDALALARKLRPHDMEIGLNLAEALLQQGTLREASVVLDDVSAELELTWPKDERAERRLEELRNRLKQQEGAQAGTYDQGSSSSAANHAGVTSR